MLTTTDLDALSINPIRTLAMDAVQQANSGHPGTPMAMAPVAYARTSGVSLDVGHRDDDRSARAGLATSVGMAIAGKWRRAHLR
jgi:Transketolase, thiamine diphosphate binding domain